jgi:rare lipoprotein A
VPAPAASAPPVGRATGLADHPDYGRDKDRFRLVDDSGRVKSADEFDAWMRERQARIDAEKAAVATMAQASPAAVVAVAQTLDRASDPVVAPRAAGAVPVAPALPASGGVTLQVGVFSVRDNAERALAALRAAGIQGAWLQDVAGADRRLWRLRVGRSRARPSRNSPRACRVWAWACRRSFASRLAGFRRAPDRARFTFSPGPGRPGPPEYRSR